MSTFLVIESGLVVLAVVLAFTVPRLGWDWFEAVERSFGKLAERRGLSVIVVGLTALTLRAALLPILPIPQPGVEDEFGYLLLSDTFAHGRLTNTTSPMWVHFESFFIIWHPTYTSMYYPAQGLIMAFGQAVMGHPFWGIWLSVGLMCAAITWMLQGWLSPGWALLGGFLAVIRFGTFSYWANSYWGGAVAAVGGALVLGALPRMKQHKRVRHALLMGLGFAILANSRPYEGLFFGIPVAVAILVWLWKMKRSGLGSALKHSVAPLLAVLALTLVSMGYYFWRTTGSPFNTPFFVYEKAYNPVPYFPWQPLKPIPVYHHRFLRDDYLGFFALPRYREAQSVKGLASIKLGDCATFWAFFLGPLFTLPLVFAFMTLPFGFSYRDIKPETRFLLLVLGITLAGEALPLWFSPHYAAPLTCVILALVLLAMRRLRQLRWRNKPTGLFITRAVPSICILLFLLAVGFNIIRWSPGIVPVRKGLMTWYSLTPSNKERAAMLAKLKQQPGKQLVIVHHDNIHDNSFFEWVYNRADLNSAKVVWAHDMGPAKNKELINYFKHRHVWLVNADDNPPRLEPYPGSTGLQPHSPANETEAHDCNLVSCF